MIELIRKSATAYEYDARFPYMLVVRATRETEAGHGQRVASEQGAMPAKNPPLAGCRPSRARPKPTASGSA